MLRDGGPKQPDVEKLLGREVEIYPGSRIGQAGYRQGVIADYERHGDRVEIRLADGSVRVARRWELKFLADHTDLPPVISNTPPMQVLTLTTKRTKVIEPLTAAQVERDFQATVKRLRKAQQRAQQQIVDPGWARRVALRQRRAARVIAGNSPAAIAEAEFRERLEQRTREIAARHAEARARRGR